VEAVAEEACIRPQEITVVVLVALPLVGLVEILAGV